MSRIQNIFSLKMTKSVLFSTCPLLHWWNNEFAACVNWCSITTQQYQYCRKLLTKVLAAFSSNDINRCKIYDLTILIKAKSTITDFVYKLSSTALLANTRHWSQTYLFNILKWQYFVCEFFNILQRMPSKN